MRLNLTLQFYPLNGNFPSLLLNTFLLGYPCIFNFKLYQVWIALFKLEMTEYIFSETDREENILGFMAMQRGGEGGVFENLKGTALTIFN